LECELLIPALQLPHCACICIGFNLDTFSTERSPNCDTIISQTTLLFSTIVGVTYIVQTLWQWNSKILISNTKHVWHIAQVLRIVKIYMKCAYQQWRIRSCWPMWYMSIISFVQVKQICPEIDSNDKHNTYSTTLALNMGIRTRITLFVRQVFNVLEKRFLNSHMCSL
jgi:hypothetical protein